MALASNTTTSFPNGVSTEKLIVGGTDITAQIAEIAALEGLSAAEVAFIDGAVAGTAAAGKAVVAGASSEVSGIGALTTTGNAALGDAAADTFKVHGAATSGAQSLLVAAPTAPGAVYSQAESVTLEVAVNAIITCLRNHGLMANA